MKPRVLVTAAMEPDSPNPYILLFGRSIGDDVTVIPFTWRAALFERYDIVHAQWLEYIFRGGNRTKAVIKYCLASAWLTRLSLSKVPLVETKHNLTPHSLGNPLEERLFRRWARFPRTMVYLNNSSENDLREGRVILHGAYPVDVERPPEAGMGPFLTFGSVGPRKGLESLLDAYSEATARNCELPEILVWGNPDSDVYRDTLIKRSHGVDQVKFRFGHIPERALHEQIASSRGVVLPYPALYNSGALLLALSVGTPVLAPRTPATESLLTEFGSDWITLFETRVTVEDLERFDGILGDPRDESRRALALKQRAWHLVGAEHVRLYAQLLRPPKGRLKHPEGDAPHERSSRTGRSVA